VGGREVGLMADSAAASAGRVFISYRREETAWQAGWLFDRLADRFGRGQIFKDVDSIQLGDDFVEVITSAVGSCDVLLALIGEQWLSTTDEQGRARLDDPNDFVRLEIEAALTRNVRVIPILIGAARMPRADQLPPSLAKLVRRQALELSPSRFDFDTSRLLKVLDRALAEVHARPTITEPEVPVVPRQAQLRGLYDEAGAELRLGHFQTAIDLLDELLALDPSHPGAAELRTAAGQQLHLADTYQSAIDAEAASDWTGAATAYAGILDLDATYRDAAARREACQARQQLLDLQGELRNHAAAGRWQAVLDVNAELGRLDSAATDPDGLATQAQHAIDDKKRADELAHRYTRARNAEDSHDWAVAASQYAQILQLDPQYRDTAARQDSCLRQQRTSEVSSQLDHHGADQESAKVRETFNRLTALDPGGPMSDTVLADRARLESAAPRVPKRRRVLTMAAAGAAAACVVLAGLLIWHPWSSDGSAGTTGSVTPSPTSPVIRHPNAWSPLPSIPTGLEGAGAASFHNQLWVVGGNAATADHHPLELVQVFDPASGRWTSGPSLPHPVGEAGVVSDGKSLYVIGGAGGFIGPTRGWSEVLATVYRLDSPQGPWIVEQPLPQGRVSGAVAFDGTRIVFAGGVGADGQSHREVFALTGGSWQQIASLTQQRDNFGAASDGKGAVWFFGGTDPNGKDLLRTILRLRGSEVVTDGSLPFGVRTPSVVAWPGAGVCLIGGQGNPNGAVSCVARPAGAWDPPPLRQPRGGLAAAVVGDRVYTIGGYFDGMSASSVSEAIPVS
jgi:tetratricopeptide (TPR) repeat protein